MQELECVKEYKIRSQLCNILYQLDTHYRNNHPCVIRAFYYANSERTSWEGSKIKLEKTFGPPAKSEIFWISDECMQLFLHTWEYQTGQDRSLPAAQDSVKKSPVFCTVFHWN